MMSLNIFLSKGCTRFMSVCGPSTIAICQSSGSFIRNCSYFDQKKNPGPSSDVDAYRRHLYHAKHLLVITGAGISAESGIPTFRGVNGMWRKRKIENFATPEGFESDPGLVWEFYHYRRELVLTKKPNAAHKKLVEVEKWMLSRKRNFTLITMNVDGLQKLAGSKNLVELHGSLYETRCTKCKNVELNRDSPICPDLNGTEHNVNEYTKKSALTISQLPRCKKCGGLLRPNVVWYNEDLVQEVNDYAWDRIDQCDLSAIIGSSSMVFPGALFAPQIAHRHVPVGEFNLKHECYSDSFDFFFKGRSAKTVPKVFDLNWKDPDPSLYKPIPDVSENIKSFQTRSFHDPSSSVGTDKTSEINYSSVSGSSHSSSSSSSSDSTSEIDSSSSGSSTSSSISSSSSSSS